MRLGAVLLIAAALGACNLESSPPPSPSPMSPAHTLAADLRTRMDLLLSEQVMIIAKQAAAAVNHSDEYTAYTSLLAVNSADLSSLIANAFGNTAGVQFAQAWNAQNGYLVDYAIGVVTHNDDKAKAAIGNLDSTFTPQLTQLIAAMSHLPSDPTGHLIAEQVNDDKAFVDDVFAAGFRAYYADLHRAYAHTSRLGDLLSEQIAVDFPDRYPGDPTDPSVDARVTLNLDLQEHSYLATMATDATVSGRGAENAEAILALTGNNDAMRSVVEDNRFSLAWSREVGSLSAYALNGDPASARSLTDTFVSELAVVSKASPTVISHHENAIIKVVDDQRAKAPTLAGDDRAAATSMQPIADSVM